MSFWPQNVEVFHVTDDESPDLTKTIPHTSLNGNGSELKDQNGNDMTLIENSTKILQSIVKSPGSNDNEESNPCKKTVVISDKQHFLLERKRSRIDPGILFDSHCHYDFLLNKLNLRSYKEYCYKYPKGDFGRDYMGGIINNFCDPLSWGDYNGSIPLFDELMKDPRIYFTFGCHPRLASAFNDSHLAKLEKLIQTKRVVALGEIGLDFADVYGKSTSPHDVQIAVFYEQLLLAKKYNKPIVLHIRDAEQEAMEVLKRANIPSNYNIHRHCMINSWEVAKKWLEEFPESMIGITNIVTKPEMSQVHDLVKQLPLDRIVLETDAPYFYPYHVVKWKSNHHVSYPMLVIHVAEKIVELRKNESLNEFILAVKKNVEKVYRLSEHEEPIDVNQIEFKSVGCQTMYPEEYVFSYFNSSDEDSDFIDEEADI